MLLLDGKSLSVSLKEEIKATVAQRVANGHRPPHLAAVLIGNDGASETYVASKVRACEEAGFLSTLIRRDSTISEAELLQIVHQLNHDAGIMATLFNCLYRRISMLTPSQRPFFLIKM